MNTKFLSRMVTAQVAINTIRAQTTKSIFELDTGLVKKCERVVSQAAAFLARFGVDFQPDHPDAVTAIQAEQDRRVAEKANITSLRKRAEAERAAAQQKLLAEQKAAGEVRKFQNSESTGW